MILTDLTHHRHDVAVERDDRGRHGTDDLEDRRVDHGQQPQADDHADRGVAAQLLVVEAGALASLSALSRRTKT